MRGMMSERLFERLVIPCLVALALVGLAAKPLLACEEPPGPPPEPCHCFAHIEAPLPPPGCDPFGQALCSGTNCTASGVISGSNCPGTPNTFVSWARLWIGGDCVAKYDSSKQGGSYCQYQLTVTWSSTHFPSDTVIDVMIEGQDTAGCYCSKTKQVRIVNRAYAAANEIACGGDIVCGGAEADNAVYYCRAMNHFASDADECCYVANMLSKLPPNTVWYLDSHAMSCIEMWDCSGQNALTAEAIRAWVQLKNPCAQPPYNFAFPDGCSTVGSDCENLCCSDPAHGMGYRWAFMEGAGAVDRAVLGWCTPVKSEPQHCNFSIEVWHRLSMGDWLSEAACTAFAMYPVDANDYGDGAARWGICGDGGTTLVSVYNHPGHWFYPPLPY